ncbi:hypothetical protein [Nonlabens spongiae]|uniref:hypothetical protein n=1 Tax=Nonlabens spongiae TaxID=331648 RepID=UPI0012F4AB0B|nr:hypothetical protein [Nonlabens spongiae]
MSKPFNRVGVLFTLSRKRKIQQSVAMDYTKVSINTKPKFCKPIILSSMIKVLEI